MSEIFVKILKLKEQNKEKKANMKQYLESKHEAKLQTDSWDFTLVILKYCHENIWNYEEKKRKTQGENKEKKKEKGKERKMQEWKSQRKKCKLSWMQEFLG